MCPLCRGVGYVVSGIAGDVVACPDPACELETLQLEAAEQLAAGVAGDGGRAVFQGGTFKLSVAIKGFEVSPAEIQALVSLPAGPVLTGPDVFMAATGPTKEELLGLQVEELP